MSKVECQVLNVMSNAAQGSNARGPGEGAGRESDMNAGEETLGDQIAAGR